MSCGDHLHKTRTAYENKSIKAYNYLFQMIYKFDQPACSNESLKTSLKIKLFRVKKFLSIRYLLRRLYYK